MIVTGDVMNYVKRSSCGVSISCRGDKQNLQIGIKAYINKLCQVRLASYDGIIKVTKNIFHFQRLIPIYAQKDILLFPLSSIRNMDVLYINYLEIYKINRDKNNNISIMFYDHTTLNVKISTVFLSKQMKRCERIMQFLNKKSQESVYNYGLSLEI